jgi:hypothetical protein
MVNTEQEARIGTLAGALGVHNDFNSVRDEVAWRADLRAKAEWDAAMTVVFGATATDANWAWACGISRIPPNLARDLRSALEDAGLGLISPTELVEKVAQVFHTALN